MKSEQVLLARKLRANPTPAEKHLWEILRRRPGKLKWRRQVPMLGCIVDFYCASLRMVIEIDGREEDLDRRLSACGFNVIRFPKERALEYIFETMKAWLTGPPCLRI
jgi:very-short-patch-repair endonuclease